MLRLASSSKTSVIGVGEYECNQGVWVHETGNKGVTTGRVLCRQHSFKTHSSLFSSAFCDGSWVFRTDDMVARI